MSPQWTLRGRTLKALPDPHQKLWRSVCEHARQPVVDLVVRGVEPTSILVVVVPTLSPQAWALVERFPDQVPYWGDDPSDGLVAVLGTTGVGDDPADLDDPLLACLADVPARQFGLLVVGPDGWPVVTGCVLPPEAPEEKTEGGLNNPDPPLVVHL